MGHDFGTIGPAIPSCSRTWGQTVQCRSCQHENSAKARFCEDCGAPLELSCASCGESVSSTARFCGQCGEPVAPSATGRTETRGPVAAAELPDSTGQASAPSERRQLSVMFADLVGSTERGQQLDPEDLRDVLSEYQDACSQAVKRFDGHIAQYLGDGVLVYFGYPRAHEDDAERAVRAGLAIQDALAEINRRNEQSGTPEISARIGIHAGLVVVGEVGEAGSSGEVAGDVVVVSW